MRIPSRREVMLLARTVRHARPSQVAHRARLRGQQAVFRRAPAAAAALLTWDDGPVAGWPADYRPLDLDGGEAYPSPEANAEGRFSLLGEERSVGLGVVPAADWSQASASRLWQFHLHYLEWAWAFAAHEDRDWARPAFADLWSSWQAASPFPAGDAWSPYVASLRAWVMCGIFSPLVQGTPIEADWIASLRLHGGFLAKSLERDVGGNHLLKNLKGLLGLGVFLDQPGQVRRAAAAIEQQLPIQVLADGGHYERSPAYHCQVLGDLIDVARLLDAHGGRTVQGLDEAIARMRQWLGAMLLPDGGIPLFNDSASVGPRRLELLEPTPPLPARLTVLAESGYVVIRPDGRLHIVADVGLPCPPDLPAHAHADCLSFVASVDGARVVVDTGTSTYAASARRDFERSTAAHNTVDVDGADQTEVWGAFRAARRARPTLEQASDDGTEVVVTASHDGYRRLPGRPRHRRTWAVRAGGLDITDEIVGTGSHRATARLYLRPGLEAKQDGKSLVAGPIELTGTPAPVVLGQSDAATGFGATAPVTVAGAAVSGPLPLRLHTRLSLNAPQDD